MFEIVNIITRLYNQKNRNLPDIDYCLNDLRENDFSTTFKLVSSLNKEWLSKVPQGLEDSIKNIYIRSGCSLNVCKSYMEQFQNDFYLFLRMRSEEMLPNGRMVLTFIGKKRGRSFMQRRFLPLFLLSDALVDLVLEGLVKESEADSFNLSFYQTNEGEVRE
ncbi:hypothetical protein EUTSA_v10003359mg, partial [Eutrema salsugineum]